MHRFFRLFCTAFLCTISYYKRHGFFETLRRLIVEMLGMLRLEVLSGYWHSMRVSVAPESLPPLLEAPEGSIAVHVHMYYPDLVGEMGSYLKHMPFPYDLYISVPNTALERLCQDVCASLPHVKHVEIAVVPNRGRDIAPMICTFGSALMRYSYIGHFHSKKSLDAPRNMSGWRSYLWGQLMGSEARIRGILGRLSSGSDQGIVYPESYYQILLITDTWGQNDKLGTRWCERLAIRPFKRYFTYPTGSMFWALKEAIQDLFSAGITLSDFSEEQGQKDGTLAHCVERLLGVLGENRGYKTTILKE